MTANLQSGEERETCAAMFFAFDFNPRHQPYAAALNAECKIRRIIFDEINELIVIALGRIKMLNISTPKLALLLVFNVANHGWRGLLRCRGSRRESAVAPSRPLAAVLQLSDIIFRFKHRPRWAWILIGRGGFPNESAFRRQNEFKILVVLSMK
jgi:hypothetical protein